MERGGSWNSKVPPSMPPTSQNKAQISLTLALFGPCFGMGVVQKGGIFSAYEKLGNS